MTSERWNRLRELFDRVVAVPTQQRAAALLELEPDNASLRQQVESLIHADAGADAILDRALQGGASRPPVVPGDQLSQYEVIKSIGHGGMGEVFLARRRDDLKQNVAIKIAAAAGSRIGEEASRRFLAERRILAGLNHPNIARFLDAGSTESGLPWVAMEYVNGKAITEYCKSAELSIAACLELFSKVCMAVQYAHNNLIVHRDIKPANILVDADGEPRLVDFGIAKLLAGTEEENLTKSHYRPMTPQYASPEQVSGEPLTTATDVYSLTVVLYEILTGRLPYQSDSSEPGRLERTIRETNPPSLSEAARAAGKPRAYTNSLAGDLEVIIRTGMHKDPLRRYASPAALAEDLNRYRNGFTIMARPDSFGYRVRKMVSRNRVATALAAVAVLLLFAFGVTSTLQSRRIAEERDTANQVSAFLVGIFEGADRGKTNGESVNARHLLDRGAARVEGELSSQPKTQAKLFAAIGLVYQNLGVTDSAIQMFRKEVALRRGAGAEGDAALAESLKRLVEMLRHQAKYSESIPMAREALELCRKSSPPDSQPVADALNTLGLNLNSSGKPQEAETPLQESLAIKRRIYPVAGYEIAVTLQNLSDVRKALGRHAEATPLLRESLAIRERLYGTNDARTARAIHGLAVNLNALGQLGESEQLLRRALDIHTRLYGEQHLDTSNMVNSLASLLHDLKRYDEADVLYRRALVVQEALQGENGPAVAITVNNLAILSQDRGDLATAETMFRRSLAARVKLYGESSPQTTRAKDNLGVLLMAKKQYAAAESIFRETVATWESLSGKPGPSPNLATARFRLALALVRTQGASVGAKLAEQAIGEVRRLLPEGSLSRKKMEQEYGRLLAEVGKSAVVVQ